MNQEETPKWLEELQQRSWEPEVLLSGIVLYGMFKVPPLLDNFLVFFQSNIYGSTSDINNLVAILKVGIYWLIIGLILHLITRGIWVGMVGLSYTFPGGINKERLKYKGKFSTRLEMIPPFQQIIMRLEKLSSSLFSVSFMLFMSTLGAYLYLFVLVVAPFLILISVIESVIWVNATPYQAYIMLILLLGVFALFDFVTLGYIRRFKWVVKIYWPLHRLISTLTLARFYRPIYLAFVSNYNRWVIVTILVAFSVISIFLLGGLTDNNSESSLSRISLWSSSRGNHAFFGYYDDQNDDRFSVQAQIPSDIIDGNVLKLFIPADISKEDSIRVHVNYDSLMASNKDANASNVNLSAIKKFYKIYLDDSLIIDIPMFFHFKAKTRQQGYLAYIDIKDLPVGIHHLKVGGPREMYKTEWADIPFYREVIEGWESLPNKRSVEMDDYFKIKPLLPK